MKILQNIKEGIVAKMRSFLQIDKAQGLQIVINEGLDEQAKVIKNTIWYRGDSHELSQLYSQLPNKDDTFWGAMQTADLKLRKIHTGMPAIIVDVLTGIVMEDYNGLEFKDDNKVTQAEWESIEKDNHLEDMLGDAICQGLYKGQGAFKVSFDESISKLPIIEYFPKDRVEVIKKRNRVREIIFKTNYREKNKNYILKERYGFGYIIYELIDANTNKEVPIDTIEQTKDLEGKKFAGAIVDNEGNVIRPGDFMMACLFKIKEDAIYDKKTDEFDALDEVWSQWMAAIRAGRAHKYIPSSLIPRNPKTGALIKPNAFDNQFIEIEDEASEDGKNRIHVEQPNIPTDSYAAAYASALDSALQGIISPATIGIDTKKVTDPNTSFQREKEKITLHTRGIIVGAVQNTLPELVNITFKAIDTKAKKESLREIKPTVKFGEYANPSFEAQIETVGKGKTQGVVSIEASVDELWGDTKDAQWKKDEVARLKAEQGIVDIGDEPSVGGGLLTNENESINTETPVSDEQNRSNEINRPNRDNIQKQNDDNSLTKR